MSNFSKASLDRGIHVSVQASWSPDMSQPARRHWFFTYTVLIVNRGAQPARLLSRHWFITDGSAHVSEVQGPGVVGETPRLEPGEAFEYTSGCPLPTPVGSMRGYYTMVTDDGDRFNVDIPEFALICPGSLN